MALVAVVLAGGGGGIATLLLKNVSPYAGLEPIPVADFLDAPKNYNGNTYLLEASIDAQVNERDGVGRLWSVRPLDAQGDEEDRRMVVFVPSGFEQNIQVKQRYRMQVEIKKGLCHVVSMEKY